MIIDQFPHCDTAVLHAPGECDYCDARPEWQELRQAWGIAFTGHTPGPGQMACPSDWVRGQGEAHAWGGNRPTNIVPSQTESDTSRMMYGPPEIDGPWWKR
jgi:hypothetical protein